MAQRALYIKQRLLLVHLLLMAMVYDLAHLFIVGLWNHIIDVIILLLGGRDTGFLSLDKIMRSLIV